MPLADGAWPDATHSEPWQQPPPPQVLPAQHASPGTPHRMHSPPVHDPPVEQAAASATQVSWPGSQQPLAQVSPAQQRCPAPPQTSQRSLAQARFAESHEPAAQQSSPAPPHA